MVRQVITPVQTLETFVVTEHAYNVGVRIVLLQMETVVLEQIALQAVVLMRLSAQLVELQEMFAQPQCVEMITIVIAACIAT